MAATSVQMDKKRAFIALCEAAQDVAPAVMSSKPLPWPEFVARVVLLQSKSFVIPDSTCRIASMTRAEELLEEVFRAALEVLLELIASWWKVARLWFLKEDLVKAADGSISIKPWTVEDPALCRVPAANLAECRELVWCFSSSIFNDGTYKMVKLVDKGETQRITTFVRTILEYWELSTSDRKTWQKSSLPATQEGLQNVMNILKGMLRALSDVPMEYDSHPDHLDLLWVVDRKKATPPNDLGSLNDAGAMMQAFMQKSLHWRKLRMGAEASKNIDQTLGKEHRRCLHMAQELSETRLQDEGRQEKFDEIFSDIARFENSGLRPQCNENILEQINQVLQDDFKEASKMTAGTPNRISIMRAINDRGLEVQKRQVDMTQLCQQAVTMVVTWQNEENVSGLEHILARQIKTRDQVRQLHQFLASSEGAEISDSIAQNMVKARPAVFGVLSKVLSGDEVPSSDSVKDEVTVLAKINNTPGVVKAAGGRKVDRPVQQAMTELPEAFLNLRVAYAEAEQKIGQKKLQDCADTYLPRVLSNLELWRKLSTQYHTQQMRLDLGPENLEAVDVLLDSGLRFENSAKEMIAMIGFDIIKLAAKNAKAFATAMKPTAGGHHKEAGQTWYKDLKTSELGKMSFLLTAFNEVLAVSPMSETIDKDCAKLLQDCF